MTRAPALQALLPGSCDCLDRAAVGGIHKCSISYCSGGLRGMQPGALQQRVSPASVLVQRLLKSHVTCHLSFTKVQQPQVVQPWWHVVLQCADDLAKSPWPYYPHCLFLLTAGASNGRCM